MADSMWNFTISRGHGAKYYRWILKRIGKFHDFMTDNVNVSF